MKRIIKFVILSVVILLAFSVVLKGCDIFLSMGKVELPEGRKVQIVKKEYPPHEEGSFLVEVAGVPFLIPHAYFRTPNPVVEGEHGELSLQASLPEVGEKGWAARDELPSLNWMSIWVFPFTQDGEGRMRAGQVIVNRMKVQTEKRIATFADISESYERLLKKFTGKDGQIVNISYYVRTFQMDDHYAVRKGGLFRGYASCHAFEPKTSPTCKWHWQEPGEPLAVIFTFSRTYDDKALEIIDRARGRLSDWNERAIALLGYGKKFKMGDKP